MNEEAAHEKTKGLLKTTLETAQGAVKERDDLKASLSTVTKERDDEKAAHTKTKELLTLAEGALAVKGVKADQVVPASADDGAGKGLVEKFLAASASERVAMLRDNGDAIYKAARAQGVKLG